jgi:hypothetical protein
MINILGKLTAACRAELSHHGDGKSLKNDYQHLPTEWGCMHVKSVRLPWCSDPISTSREKDWKALTSKKRRHSSLCKWRKFNKETFRLILKLVANMFFPENKRGFRSAFSILNALVCWCTYLNFASFCWSDIGYMHLLAFLWWSGLNYSFFKCSKTLEMIALDLR